MNVRISIAVVVFLCSLGVSCNRVGGKPELNHAINALPSPESKQEVDVTKEAAISIATQDLKKTRGDTDQFTVFPCDQVMFWRIVFEPKAGGSNNTGPEYVVDKKTGFIAGKRQLPLIAETNSKLSPDSLKISRDMAIALTRPDATKAYGPLTGFDLTICELSNVWRIIYSPKSGLNGGGPEYVVDKTSGKILDKQYSQ
jgi:hypothetical protein